MTDPRLPGLNYNTPVTINDLDHLEQVYTDEFARRMQAVMASYRAAGASFGILSETDPINASVVSEPLYVQQNDVDGMLIDVYPGTAAAENGMLLWLESAVEGLEMVNQEVGQQNVVFVEYVVIDDEDTTIKTRFNSSEEIQRTRTPDTHTDPTELRTLQVSSIGDWDDDTLFPPDRRKNLTPLALVEIISKTTSPFKEVQVDLSRTTLTTNRPWFSPVDITHRADVGTGSSTVPHNLGLNDLSQGNLTLYDQLLNHGIVISRDVDVPGVPGRLCFETITPIRVLIDDEGAVTGQVGQRYVELVKFPVRLLGAYSLVDNDNEILVELLPYTNILVIHHNDVVPSGGFRVQYACAQAGEPLVDSLINDEIHFEQPIADKEIVVSGGKGYDKIKPSFIDSFNNTRARISLGTAAQIPKRYRILLDHDGELLFTPQHILCATKLDDIGTAVYTFTTAMLGAARVRVGLQNVNLGSATVIRIRVTGTDQLGASVTEDVTFDISTYDVPVIDCKENLRNYQVTDTVFASLQSMVVLERTADGPSTAICVYADLDPMQTDAIRDACPLAEAMWDGNSICRIRDIRPLTTRLQIPTRTSSMKPVSQVLITALTLEGAKELHEVIGDDLRDPTKMRLNDPLRLYKFADGLRSTILPEHPGVEVSDDGLGQDIYVTQALRLPAPLTFTSLTRRVHVVLLGQDSQQFLLNGIDGVAPQLEYRTAPTTDPDDWEPWVGLTAVDSAGGSNFQFALGVDDFKMQLRAKGSITGIVAVQYLRDSTLLPRLTTTERDSLAAVNGMLIYNTTANKFQGYEDGAWVNLV